MSYALQTLWHERTRYASGVLAVTFSAVLIALQCGLLLGLFKITSIPIDNTTADLWIGSTAVSSVDLGKPIPNSYMTRVAGMDGVKMPEQYISNFANFFKPTGGTELCFLLGSLLDDGTSGAATLLTKEQREALTMPYAIIVDESDVKRLALNGTDGEPKINGKRVHLVGTVKGLKSLAAPWVFCSLHTARQLMGPMLPPDHVTYLLARCESPARAKQVADELRAQYPNDMVAYTAEDFSYRSRMYWLTRTKAGLAIGYAALLGLIVGAVITAQTLYSATAANAKEFAILLALGIPRWRISLMVITQSFWVGIIGIAIAYPVCLGLRALAMQFNTDVDMRWEILAGTATITVGMALIAGTLALRSVKLIEPMNLLR
ncbi:abc transporter permease : ABC-type antimicrobial peptide transport system, permease component OS=Singulisphaera acidiphila (strain ATCC BAA-1392 / DSM 18658 / VKM B-2454 / MOB10) GN=Sinac_2084 PE=4 SV=1: FtsX [Gemmataceae bacterium]|nr:abc transporter permease : ABC-type antimicrobial peptide transport system, permease component OS=Singulisphaera acidiphila (strain ATCC BAA-1392 / DSM 18658 / VKM B-2454 / MOB10) GN=Sinac_2084 PE=4 SV=1: FtsX [Gemmataceae bacterium]VTU02662.1 abc transporter permease : ABC-type antimicrobial peptide transport system, permease component OS=Singulisphaera acidiphila (strain ATCC BAA-1392 / DSM 18658 / VKM B-2454 / MOB10) GN=Sinac_2084 PE=4 SV=1: FtsX [Gemmataceae bacterium]